MLKLRTACPPTDNERFTRLWYEVNIANVGLGLPSAADAKKSEKKWFPYNKGGLFRRWFGNFLQVVNWGKTTAGRLRRRLKVHLGGELFQKSVSSSEACHFAPTGRR
jgi:hypothetical protein